MFIHYLGTFAKLRKAANSFIHARPSHGTPRFPGRIFMKFDI